MAGLRVEGLRRPGLAPAELAVPPGRILCLYGPSGSGKTLLLRAIADLDPNDGEVYLDERPRSAFSGPAWRRRVIYVPAESHWWAERVRPHAPHWPEAGLAALGFGPEVLDREVRGLSTGERQRLAILRALARSPRALLLDEPTANLDADNGRRVEALLDDYRRRHRAPLLWVSHDPAQRARMADDQREIRAGVVQ